MSDRSTEYSVLIGSVNTAGRTHETHVPDLGLVRLVYGDYSNCLRKVCENLEKARDYAVDSLQRTIISDYLSSFRNGDIEAYKESQRKWIQDKNPSVESIIGFVEPYRDPHGVRAEFEGLVAIVNENETKELETSVSESSVFIQRLLWARPTTENGGKGPFERSDLPDSHFSSIHSELPCTSMRSC